LGLALESQDALAPTALGLERQHPLSLTRVPSQVGDDLVLRVVTGFEDRLGRATDQVLQPVSVVLQPFVARVFTLGNSVVLQPFVAGVSTLGNSGGLRLLSRESVDLDQPVDAGLREPRLQPLQIFWSQRAFEFFPDHLGVS
jgi:hypothetical protein